MYVIFYLYLQFQVLVRVWHIHFLVDCIKVLIEVLNSCHVGCSLSLLGSIAASPTEIPSFSEARQVVCALNCTFIIHSNGSLSACGQNENGRLGLGNSEDQQVLALISALKGKRSILQNRFLSRQRWESFSLDSFWWIKWTKIAWNTHLYEAATMYTALSG